MIPLVSILIPAYNAERWIDETLRSALGQTWPHKEIIVVDDGSIDGTSAIARRFESSSVKVISQANQGASAARNGGFKLCQGDYVQWLDADDLLAPDKIEKQMEEVAKLGSAKTLLSSAWGYFYHRTVRAKFKPTALWEDVEPVEWLLRKMEHNLQMTNFSWLVSRELTELAGPWDTTLSLDDDGEYFARVVLASDRVRFVPEAKGFYRRSSASSLGSAAAAGRKLDSQFVSLKRHIEYLLARKDNPRARAACLTLLETWQGTFYPWRLDLVDQMKQLAAQFGGRLSAPRLPWKYAWIERLAGRRLAGRIQQRYNLAKGSLCRTWDGAMKFAGGHEGDFRR